MIRSSAMDHAASAIITLDDRRARLRRRRRRHAIREWAGVAIVATVGVWLAAAALMTLVAH